MKLRKINPTVVFLCSVIILIVALLVAISVGSVSYSNTEIFAALFSNTESRIRDIIVSIRLPRIILASLVGMNLAISGAYMQAVMRNPMADPGVIGVSSGAALAAVTTMLVFPHMSRFVPIFAFIGGCLACALVFLLSWKNGTDSVRLILSGVAINALLGGGVSLMSLLYSDRIQGILLWVNGSLNAKSLPDVYRLLPFSIVGLILSLFCIPYANALLLGDDVAKSLGVPVHFARVLLSAVAAYMTGVSIATVGLIGFIGLIIPHIARLLVGSDYKILIPLSAVLGAILLVSADTVARTAFSPIEIPVGVVMSVLGGPFFIWLLRRRRRL